MDRQTDAFPYRVKSLLNGQSVRNFAQQCGVSEGALRRYLSGSSEPGLSAMKGMARAASVNIEWLATGEGPKRKNEGNSYNVSNSSGVIQFDTINGGVSTGNVSAGSAQATPKDDGIAVDDDFLEFIELFRQYGNPAVLKSFKDKLLKLKEISEG
ncbi:MAG: hypothetical protein B6I36_02425 [Desulfobacteraceae bacterium 4572_35.1]|nr:MAG: hypothetical protein B6I36_02425 [Desulfobacteraceae bacterium 4572_35.1]